MTAILSGLRPAGEHPYPDHAARDPRDAASWNLWRAQAEEALARRRGALRPVFTAKDPAPTRPMPALREPARMPANARAASRDPLRALLSDLRGLDFRALDEAADAGLTYAQAVAAREARSASPAARVTRGRTPLHDTLTAARKAAGGDAPAAAWRAPVRAARRHGEAAGFLVRRLAYPPLGSPDRAYDRLFRQLRAITGTPGVAWWAPAVTAGGAA